MYRNRNSDCNRKLFLVLVVTWGREVIDIAVTGIDSQSRTSDEASDRGPSLAASRFGMSRKSRNAVELRNKIT